MTQSNESPFVPSFDALVDKKLQEAHVPGLSIAVIRDDKVHAKVGLAWLGPQSTHTLNIPGLRHRVIPIGESNARNTILYRQHHEGISWSSVGSSDRV